MSWYTKGGEKEFDQFKKDSPNQPNLYRFWLKEKDRKEVVFIADEQFAVWEHTVPMGNNKYENFTCSRDANCRFCGEKKNATYIQYCSVLDMTPYQAKDGTTKKFSKKAFPIKGAAIEILNRRRQEAGGSLVGYRVACFRDGDKSPNCGNDFTLVKKEDISKLSADIAKPLDFEKMLAPLPPHVIEARMKFSGPEVQTRDRNSMGADPFSEGGGSVTPSTTSVAPGATSDDDGIPF